LASHRYLSPSPCGCMRALEMPAQATHAAQAAQTPSRTVSMCR